MKKIVSLMLFTCLASLALAQKQPYNFPTKAPTDTDFIPTQIKTGSDYFGRRINLPDAKAYFLKLATALDGDGDGTTKGRLDSLVMEMVGIRLDTAYIVAPDTLRLVFANNSKLNVVLPSSGGISDGDKGDITVSSGVWNIDANTITGTEIASASIPIGDLNFTPWYASNDGSGSGLDADLLDGVSSAAFGLVANPLSQFANTTSAQLAGIITNETGSGVLVFGTSPTLTTPALGTPSAVVLTNGTGLPLGTGVTGTLPVGNGGTGLSSLGTSLQLLRVNSGATALEYFTPSYITGNQTITLSGDLSGSGTTSIAATIGTGAVTSSKILDGTIAAADLNQMGASTNQVLMWNGSAWAPATPSSGVTGSGTTNKVAKFTGSSAVGNSSITDDGSTVTVNPSGQTPLVVIGGLHSGIVARAPNAAGNANMLLENSADNNNSFIWRRDSWGAMTMAYSSTYPYGSDAAEIMHYNPSTSRLRIAPTIIVRDSVNNVLDAIGSGTPEGSVTAGIGSTYRRTNGGSSTTYYVKESGTGNTGWVAHGAGGGSYTSSNGIWLNGADFQLGGTYFLNHPTEFSAGRRLNWGAFTTYIGTDNADSLSTFVLDIANRKITIGGTGASTNTELSPNLISLKNSAGNVASTLSQGSNTFATGTFAKGLVITKGSTLNSDPTLTIKPHSSQTGPILNWQNTSGVNIGTIDITGQLGVGTTSPDRQLHNEVQDAATNSITNTTRQTHGTNSTAAAGFGLGQEIELENASGTNVVASSQEVSWVTATNGIEDSKWALDLKKGGSTIEAASVTSGTMTLGAAGAGGAVKLNGNTSGSVTIAPPASPTTYTLTVPADAGGGVDGKVWKTNGSGIGSWTIPGSEFSGVYTPTIALTFSDTVLTVYNAKYWRTDSILHVTGAVRIGHTAGSTVETFTVSLPPGISSNFNDQYGDVSGTVSINQSDVYTIGLSPKRNIMSANTTTDKISITYEPIGSGSGLAKRNIIQFNATCIIK